MTEELDELREEVKKVTMEIIKMVGKRMELVKTISEIKRQRKLPIEDLETEKKLRRAILEACETFNINNRLGLKILNLLIYEAKRIQTSKNLVS